MRDYPFYCPECLCHFDDADELGPHIERHRPFETAEEADRGKGCVACPKGCGRFFGLAQKRNVPMDLYEHVRLCEGLLPLEESGNERQEAEAYRVIGVTGEFARRENGRAVVKSNGRFPGGLLITFRRASESRTGDFTQLTFGWNSPRSL